MTLVSDTDRARVAEAIARAEAGTTGEIVAVIAPDSGTYLHVPFLWAALAALAVPLPLIFWTWWPIQTIYLLQLVTFVVLACVLMYRPIRFRLVPWTTKQARAHKRALEQFMAQNLHTMDNHTGVLIFVSVAERYATIVADEGINAKVPQETWNAMVARLASSAAAGRYADGFAEAIDTAGALLAEHFPRRPDDRNELDDHIVEL